MQPATQTRIQFYKTISDTSQNLKSHFKTYFLPLKLKFGYLITSDCDKHKHIQISPKQNFRSDIVRKWLCEICPDTFVNIDTLLFYSGFLLFLAGIWFQGKSRCRVQSCGTGAGREGEDERQS